MSSRSRVTSSPSPAVPSLVARHEELPDDVADEHGPQLGSQSALHGPRVTGFDPAWVDHSSLACRSDRRFKRARFCRAEVRRIESAGQDRMFCGRRTACEVRLPSTPSRSALTLARTGPTGFPQSAKLSVVAATFATR